MVRNKKTKSRRRKRNPSDNQVASKKTKIVTEKNEIKKLSESKTDQIQVASLPPTKTTTLKSYVKKSPPNFLSQLESLTNIPLQDDVKTVLNKHGFNNYRAFSVLNTDILAELTNEEKQNQINFKFVLGDENLLKKLAEVVSKIKPQYWILPISDTMNFFSILEAKFFVSIPDKVKKILSKYRFNNYLSFSTLDNHKLKKIENIEQKDQPSFTFLLGHKLLLNSLAKDVSKTDSSYWNIEQMVDPAECNTINLIKAKIYVDKTKFCQKFIERGGHITCTHPSKFGKSLFLDTIDVIGSGNKELFEDYYIGIPENGYDWKKYPVIKFNFATIMNLNYKKSVNIFKQQIYKIANKYNITLESNVSYDILLSNLISQLADMESAGYEKKVIILVDEYDSILNIMNYEQRLKMFIYKNMDDNSLSILVRFFLITKDQFQQGNIQLLFVTGVIPIALSDTSRPNLNLNEEYDEMFGFTKREIAQYFKVHINNFIETWNNNKKNKKKINNINDFFNKLAHNYNGYSFSNEIKKNIYNPWSVYSCLYYGSFDRFWCESGFSTLLMESIYRDPLQLYFIFGNEELFSIDDLNARWFHGCLNTRILLFQTGYFTIDKDKSIPETGDKSEKIYKLVFPNNEIKNALMDLLKNTLEKNNKFKINNKKYIETIKKV